VRDQRVGRRERRELLEVLDRREDEQDLAGALVAKDVNAMLFVLENVLR